MALTESQEATQKRREDYYPSDPLKKQLNDYSLKTGEYKSEVAERLMRSFFVAYNAEGRMPKVINLLP